MPVRRVVDVAEPPAERHLRLGRQSQLVERDHRVGRPCAQACEGRGVRDAGADHELESDLVGALGGTTKRDDGAESGYFATRAALAQQITAAARHLAGGAASAGAPALVRAINGIATRFSVPVSQKAIAQAAPLIGAASGAALNLVFIAHFQRVARGHFIVRRLERVHGPAVIRDAYHASGGNA